MKAIHLLNTLKHGGAENVAFNYAKVLLSLGVSSVFVGKSKSKGYEKMVERIAEIKHHLTLSLLKNSDYIFLHSNINLLKLLFFRLFIFKWKNKKIIYIQHLNYSEKKFHFYSILINFLCTDFIQITPITEHLVKRYIRINVHFIANFYINRYRKEDWNKINKEVRQRLEIPFNAKVVTYSAVFRPGKNVEDFIRLADIMQQDTNYIFVLIGDGPQADIVRAYRGKNLKWLGFVNDVEQFLIASDFYCFFSRVEMMPMALIEAINTEKRIIAYPTLVNDFLLGGKTFEKISSDIFIQPDLPSGNKIQKYDFEYASKMLRQILK